MVFINNIYQNFELQIIISLECAITTQLKGS